MDSRTEKDGSTEAHVFENVRREAKNTEIDMKLLCYSLFGCERMCAYGKIFYDCLNEIYSWTKRKRACVFDIAVSVFLFFFGTRTSIQT